MAAVPSTPGPVYEVTLDIDREAAGAVEEWLAAHVREMLELPGFVRAVTWSADSDDPGRVRRVTQYFLEDEAALESYLAGPAERMRREGLERFPERYTATRRVLRHADSTDPVAAPVSSCLNCGTLLTGQYCASCGQRAKSRLISIFELLRDAFGDLFELDSRLWQTLGPLAVRPGKLTRDYLMGRRARYMPPFRTYLVLSLAFFLIAFNPLAKLSLMLEPVEQDQQQEPPSPARAAEIREQVLRDLEAEGGAVGEAARRALEEADSAARAAEQAPPTVPEPPAAAGADRSGLQADTNCEFEDFDPAVLPGWLGRRLTRERLEAVCERVNADGGRAFLDALVDNIPASLFILLPLMALVLKVLYPMSRRYYVEHLLFVLHFHAFVFLILTVDVLFSRAAALLHVPVVENLAGFAVGVYVPVYLYKGLRRVYGQGRAATLSKFVLLLLAYFAGLLLILLFVLLYTALSL
ncbi:MAG TPA: DUF4286 family protein [Woeseiaceae bacterium]